MYDIIFVPIIVITVYWIFDIYKFITNYKEKFLRLIPVLAAPLGGGLGILLYFIAPYLLPVDNIFMAFMIGSASGLASTGTNQIFKQFSKNSIDRKNKNNKLIKKE